MEAAPPLQKKSTKPTGITAGGETLQLKTNPFLPRNSIQNPLQFRKPSNNPIQFTRKQARDKFPTVDDKNLEAYYQDTSIQNSQKVAFILINNHGLQEGDKDYIDINDAITKIPEYDLEDRYGMDGGDEMYEDWQKEIQNKKMEEPPDKEDTVSDKDKKHEGVLPSLTLDDRSITLVGTRHGDNETDYSEHVPDSKLKNAHLLLEYPSLTNTGREQYTSDDIAKVKDNTQKSLAKAADGRNIIGGDGRKAFDKKQTLHSITTRHKKSEHVEIGDELIKDETIRNLATDYVNGALGIQKTDAATVSASIESLVKYHDGTISLLVLLNTFTLVGKRSENLSPDRKAAIARKVIQSLEEDLSNLKSNYIVHLHDTERILDILPPGQNRDEEKSKIEKTTQKEFTGNKISLLHDAVCNILLFTEVIASDKNMVVAFGAHHIAPLQELIKEVANPDTVDSDKDMEKTGTLQSEKSDLNDPIQKLLRKFLKTETYKYPLGVNNCLIESILNQLKIEGETRGIIIESVRKSLEENGIPTDAMLHATTSVLNLIASEIHKVTGIGMGTVTIKYNHISEAIQKNFDTMNINQLQNLLGQINDIIRIGDGPNINITHTGYAHFE